MEFIYADTLKAEYDVFGHFYELRVGLEILPCRSSLDIVSKSAEYMFNELPDSIVIMMNPGSSRPRDEMYLPKTYFPDEIFSSDWNKEIVPALPDIAQYQIMRLMRLNNWMHVKVLNLSDLREANSGVFSEKFKRLSIIDASSPHCVTHECRSIELRNALERRSRGAIVAAWGSMEVLRQSATRLLSLAPAIIGLPTFDIWFRHASPHLFDHKRKWLEDMHDLVNSDD